MSSPDPAESREPPEPAGPVRIVLRPLGPPLTLGLSGLGIGSVVQSGVDLRWFPAAETRSAGWILLAVPFVLQLVAAVLTYLARDGATGAAVGVLSGTWLGVALVHLTTGSGQNGALGTLLLAAGASVMISALTVGRSNMLAAAAFALAGARFAIEGVYQSGAPSGWQHASGIVGLVLAGLIVYALIAFELEGQERGPLLPTFRRGRGRVAVEGQFHEQLEGLANEPGVRLLS